MAESLNGVRATVQKILKIVSKKYNFQKYYLGPLDFVPLPSVWLGESCSYHFLGTPPSYFNVLVIAPRW